MDSLGDRLRVAREKKNLKQTQVMAKTGINNKTLSGYEKGVSEPDIETLKILANLYEVSVDWLVGEDKSKTYKNSETRDYDFIIQEIKNKYPDVDITDPTIRKKLMKAIDLVLDDYEKKQ